MGGPFSTGFQHEPTPPQTARNLTDRADAYAKKDSTLLMVSDAAFQKHLAQAPELAAPFLLAMGRTLKIGRAHV